MTQDEAQTWVRTTEICNFSVLDLDFSAFQKYVHPFDRCIMRPVKEESRAPKKARTEAGTSEDPIEPPLESSAARNGIMRENIELMFKEMTKVVTAGIGQCVKEIKFLRDRMEAMKKIVGINKKDTLEMKIGTAGIGQGFQS
ncbi:hypothetical protein HID58_006550 [Brassica napus]|uniref:Uncharacterized protein n=1 Tax=Brassica napus TaxID=3708 RepID=A0ABQ8EBR3_BRANA|nr:hypothetical protein HID58_006550 [Brassica napus]